ncbi:MAG: response regulator transcription factor [Anaerolineae bacterium]|nr:response regulator transcription factor [Anaerolineae bacterium]
MTSEKIHIVLVDDHPTVLFGMKAILEGFDDFLVVGLAENGMKAVQVCEQQQPHVVLMDLSMPKMDGLEATRRVREKCPGSQVLILTSSENDIDVAQALEAGAIGYLIKNAAVQETVNAIRAAYSGKRSLSPEALEGLIRYKTNPPSLEAPLTEREHQILVLLTQGLSNSQMAYELSLSTSTIKFHLRAVFQKLNVTNRAEAVAKAFEEKLV